MNRLVKMKRIDICYYCPYCIGYETREAEALLDHMIMKHDFPNESLKPIRKTVMMIRYAS